jgi:hypothetical protein
MLVPMKGRKNLVENLKQNEGRAGKYDFSMDASRFGFSLLKQLALERQPTN